MQDSALSTIGLPLALAIIMLGLGLHLRLDDFKRIATQPKAILVGLVCQVLLLPAVCFGLCKVFGLPAGLAVGMMLLAASPGGITANLYSHLFKGDVALNISLTAINSVLAIVSIPLIVNFSLSSFMGSQQYIPLQFQKTLEVIALILVLMIVAILIRERSVLVDNFRLVGSASLAFNLISMGMGYAAGRVMRLTEGQNRAITFEIGIHNGTLAIYLALAVLKDGSMAIPAAIYSLLMFFTAAVFGWWVARKPVAESPAARGGSAHVQ